MMDDKDRKTDAEKEIARKNPNSVYLWKGFVQPLDIISYDIFTTLEVNDVCIGKDHKLFLTKDGEVFAQGSNEFGQLGLGSLETKAASDPVKVTGFEECIIQVACGRHHNAVVSSQGQALCWGDSSDGQCGTGSLELITSPTRVVQDIRDGFCRKHGLPNDTIHVNFESVSCGAKHTLAVSSRGELWAWGFGKPLGMGELLHAPVPRQIEILKGKTVLSVCCGEQHSLALVIKGERSRSQPSSDQQNKSTTSHANSIVKDHHPSRCSLCQQDIFTYKDTSDMCIIESNHNCERNPPIPNDSTAIVDNSSSSSFSQSDTKSSSKSPDNGQNASSSPSVTGLEFGSEDLSTKDSQGQHQTVQDTSKQSLSPQSQTIDIKSSLPSDKLHDKESDVFERPEGFVNDLSDSPDNGSVSLLSSDYEKKDYEILSAVLKDESFTSVIPDLNNSVETSFNEKDDLTSKYDVMKSPAVDSDLDSSPTKYDVGTEKKSGEMSAGDDDKKMVSSDIKEMSHQVLARNVSEISDEIVWKRQSDCEEGERDVYQQELSHGRVPRSASPSTFSTNSLSLLDQREAMKYLQKQFEDEDEESLKKEKERRTGKLTNNPPGSLANNGEKEEEAGLDFTTASSPSDFMKLIRNRAMSGIQSLTGLASDSTSPVEKTNATLPLSGQDVVDGKEGDADEVFSSPESCSMINSISSLSAEGLDNLNGKTAHHPPEGESHPSLRSGTFVEWKREMYKKDVDMSSLDAEDSPHNLRSLRTIELKKRNLSSSLSLSTAVPGDALLSPHRPVITTTEVWAWGHNGHGQLGLGDTIDRSEPVWIKYFSGRNVKKLAAGVCHSLALNDNSQVYSWGSNSHGQLGQNKATDVPSRIKFSGGVSVWDIAAGSQHSILLVDTVSVPGSGSGMSTDQHSQPARRNTPVPFQPDIFYCGKQPSEKTNSSMKKASEPTQVSSIREDLKSWVIGLSSGGFGCACKVWNLHHPLAESLFELAATERTLYNQLIKTSNLLLRPLRRSSFFSALEMSPYKTALQNMIASFGTLTTKVGRGVTDLTATIQHKRNATESRLICEHRELLEVYRNYSHVFSDFLAIGGFEFCGKAGSHFFSEIQGNILPVTDDKEKIAATSNLFLRAMRYPFYRLSAYSRIFSRMAEVAETTEDRNIYKNTMLAWDSLKLNLSSEHKVADMTKTFWENANPRLTDAMRSPSRRVLKDSKNHPLVLLSASRFSSALFVLFNDVFIYSQNAALTSFPLETLWVEAVDTEGNNLNVIVVTTPEERLELSATNASVKAEWLMSLQSSISKVLSYQKSLSSLHASGERFTPPIIRHATHIFIKQGIYKDATYSGTWLCGKVHGLGEMSWPDGSIFKGNFKRGLMHGHGTYTIVRGQGKEIQKGIWKDGKLNGQATIIYANGDLYEGYLKDGQRFGHGMLQIGCIKSNYASVYIGGWQGSLRHGYGVEDHILKGEKYMGWWSDDNRHGNGIVVTLDGMYFEGNFVNNKMTGFGVMVSDDDTLYEGDFMGITHLSGKGTLTLPQGDRMEGSFSGSLNEGLKVSGTFYKSSSTGDSDHHHHHHESHRSPKSKYFGRLCVAADNKWIDIYSHMYNILGQGHGEAKGAVNLGQRKTDTEKAWEMVAVIVSDGLKTLKEQEGSKAKLQRNNLEGLEIIPDHELSPLDSVKVKEICHYLSKAFESSYHPLGQLMNMLVDVFRSSYIGVGAHPRLLHHAVLEIKSYIRRTYKVLRLLFPLLPENGYVDISKNTEDTGQGVEMLETEEEDSKIFTAAGILYPILLPKIYPPLIDLYVLYNESPDDQYWERVVKLNRQGDVGLMAYLGIDQKFWLIQDVLSKNSTKNLSTVKDECYAQAVEQLQQISTAFSPLEKLKVIKQSFNEITKTVMSTLGDEVMWCMDDLFPIFQFVVVRAKIHHLGAEIHLTEDLMEPHLEHGEYGLMFTMLKASYFQIQNEKMPHH